MTTVGKATLGVALAALSAVGYGTVAAAPVRADDPVMHQVRYVITAANPIWPPTSKPTSDRGTHGPHPW
jgi:hypothetical protein